MKEGNLSQFFMQSASGYLCAFYQTREAYASLKPNHWSNITKQRQ